MRILVIFIRIIVQQDSKYTATAIYHCFLEFFIVLNVTLCLDLCIVHLFITNHCRLSMDQVLSEW